MVTVFGYPVKLLIDVEGVLVDATVALQFNPKHPTGVVSIDEEVIVQLIDNYQLKNL